MWYSPTLSHLYRTVTVHHAYTDRKDIKDGAEIVKLTNNADENNIVSIISSVIKIELIDGNTTINLSNGSVQITFMMQPSKGFPPTVRQHHCYLVKREVELYERQQIICVLFHSLYTLWPSVEELNRNKNSPEKDGCSNAFIFEIWLVTAKCWGKHLMPIVYLVLFTHFYVQCMWLLARSDQFLVLWRFQKPHIISTARKVIECADMGFLWDSLFLQF